MLGSLMLIHCVVCKNTISVDKGFNLDFCLKLHKPCHFAAVSTTLLDSTYRTNGLLFKDDV